MGDTVTIDDGSFVGPSLKRLGYRVRSGCAGYGYCADCVVTVVKGEANVTAPTYNERRMIGALMGAPRYRDTPPVRLACQIKVHGPVTIDLSNHPQDEVDPTQPARRPSAPVPLPMPTIRGRK